MTARILAAVFIALAAVLGAHLIPLLLPAAAVCIGGTVLVLLERIAVTVRRTGWGVLPVRRHRARLTW